MGEELPEEVLNPEVRHDIAYFFDVKNGNPNGDPDAGDMPRIDNETLKGIVSDVALKRKVRDFVDITSGEEERNKIYVQHQGILWEKQEKAYKALELDEDAEGRSREELEDARNWMCENFFDVRMFGAVMTTDKFNCGQVRGPVQVNMAESIDPIVRRDMTITRVAVTRPDDARGRTQEEVEEYGKSQKVTEMGRKQIVPYGLYRTEMFFTPHFAEDTGVTKEDLELFYKSLKLMWEFVRTSSKGMMAPRGLYVFTHDSALGEAPAHKMLERVEVERKNKEEAPRSIDDYRFEIKEDDLPSGVTLHKLLTP